MKNADIRVNKEFDLLGSKDTFHFLHLVPLLVLPILLVPLVQLSEAEFKVNVVRVDEACLGVVGVIVILSIQFSAAAAASMDHSRGNFPPDLDKRVLKDK